MRIPYSYILFIATIWLSSCVSDVPRTPTNIASPLPVSVSPTFIINSTETPIPTLPLTLTPLQANEKIEGYLQTTVDCSAPCFWGITPKQTALAQATNIFAFLRLQLEKTNERNNQEFYSTQYDLEKELDVSIILTVQDNIVKTLDVGMNVYSVEFQRKWSAYSPETLIQRYGSPSRIDFTIGRVSPTPIHTMAMYFDNVDLIIEYSGRNFLNVDNTLELCPLINEVDFIKIWMGDEPRYPPSAGIPLEKATSLSLEGFSTLMMGDPDKACFNLKDEAFP